MSQEKHADLSLDEALVAETSDVVEERTRVEGLLAKAEDARPDVSPEIYERVTGDYQEKLAEIASTFEPLRAKILSELERIRGEEISLRDQLGSIQEYLDEVRFRCQVGEFGEEKLAEYEAEKEDDRLECESKLETIEATFESASELLQEHVEVLLGDGKQEPEPSSDAPADPEAEAADEPDAGASDTAPAHTVMLDTADVPTPDGTVMLSNAEELAAAGGPEADVPGVPDGPVPDGTVMLTDADAPAAPPPPNVPDGPVPDGTVMLTDDDAPPAPPPPDVPDGPVPDGTVLLTDEKPGDSTNDMPRALLTRKSPDGGRVFVINIDDLTLGRSTTNDVVIEGASVSRKHAAISYAEGTYTIRDLSSGGGILVNGERLQEADLSSGDEIVIGSSVFEFQGPEAGA